MGLSLRGGEAEGEKTLSLFSGIGEEVVKIVSSGMGDRGEQGEGTL